MAQLVKNPPAVWETRLQSLGREDPLEKGMSAHSSVLPWRIPWQRSRVGCTPWGHTDRQIDNLSIGLTLSWLLQVRQMCTFFLISLLTVVVWEVIKRRISILRVNATSIKKIMRCKLIYTGWRRKWHPLQCSCLDSPTDRGAWRAAVHTVATSDTTWQLNNHHCIHDA